MEWLHQRCASDLSADFLNFGAGDFPFKTLFKKCFKIVFFRCGVKSENGFGTAISDAVARSSYVFRNSVSADRIVMAASRLLGATAACVIPMSLAAAHRKLHWSGCINAALVICQQIFLILALAIFLLKLFSKSASKSCFLLWRRK